jgi:uncharacterized membrane protein
MAQHKAADKAREGLPSIVDELPVDRLRDELLDAFAALAERATDVLGDKVADLTDRLTDFADGGGAGKAVADKAAGGSVLAGAVKGGLSGVVGKAKGAVGGGGSDQAVKATNIVEEIDIGVPVSVAYNQWTQFQDFSGFMKKVESVEQKSDEKLTFKAQVFWSHRTWEATILEQVPDERIVWRSEGPKGRVDGSVTFHELAPNLTRVLVVLEYYPEGLFERTGNLWRAQGRRARLELKHFRRHVMTNVLLHPDEVEGWRGEIHDGKVTRGHDEVVAEEEDADEEDDEEGADEEGAEESGTSEGEYEDEEPDEEYEDELDDELEEEDEEEDESEDEDEDEEDEEDELEDEFEDEDELEDVDEDEEDDEDTDEDEYEDEYEDDEELSEDDELEDEDEELEDEEPAPRRRRRAS